MAPWLSKRPCSPSVYQSHSIVSGLVWHHLVTIHLGSFTPSARDFFPALSDDASFWMRESRWSACVNGSSAQGAGCVVKVSATNLPDVSSGPRRLDAQGAVAWKLFTFSPILSNGWAFLGETSKFVSVSPVRFHAVVAKGDCVSFEADVADAEVIVIGAITPAGMFRSMVVSGQGMITGQIC